ncbi:MAG: hypothetical protein JRI25_14360 [Deltaproteobacteria bacterium]|nr:hypothetical protein [Deltaproteobacteria bacterium]MBW2255767.1 hypothetical protein [Deltaproteobacteria bacterium]
MRTLLLLALLLNPPAHAQPGEVAAGEDLGAWWEMQVRRLEGETAAGSYEEFLARYPTSPLAEVAWARLRDLDALDEIARTHPELRPHLQDLERSWTLHQEALHRTPRTVVVADLEPDGTARPAAAPRWVPMVVGGAGYAGSSFYGAVGARVERGPFGAVARFGRAEAFYLQGGLRLSVPSAVGLGPTVRPLGVFGEVNLDTRAAVSVGVGGRLMLRRPVWLEATVGGSLHEGRLGPSAGLEVAFQPVGRSLNRPRNGT